MTTLMFTLAVSAVGVAAYRIYKSYEKERELKMYLDEIEEEKFQAALARRRIPKLARGEIADVVMRFNPDDRKHIWDSNIPRRCSLGYETSWGFYGTGPHVMAEDILYQFTNDARFSQWGEPVRAMVEELVCFVPHDGGTISSEQIKSIVARYWDKFEDEVRATNENLEAQGLSTLGYVYRSARPSYLAAAPKVASAKGLQCS